MFEGTTGGPQELPANDIHSANSVAGGLASDGNVARPATNNAELTNNAEAAMTATEKRQLEIIRYFMPRLTAEANRIATEKAKKTAKEAAKNAKTDAEWAAVAQQQAVQLLPEQPEPVVARQMFLQALRDGRITTADENEYLLTLPSQLEKYGEQRIFEKIAGRLRDKQILAIVTGFTTTNWQDVTAADVKTFLSNPRRGQVDYRTPVGFADLRRKFLSEIHPIASPKQFDAYVRSMNELEDALYGPRFAGFRQFETLRKDAMALGQDYEADLVTETDPSLGPAGEVSGATPMLAKALKETTLTPIETEVGDQILNRSTIEGDTWRQGGQDYQLSIPNLINAGLNPAYHILVDNQEIYLSNLFNLTSDQMAAIAYVPTTVGVKVRAYYRDKAQALWRYLPDYIRGINGEGIDIFGSGFSERSIILPIALQSALNQIERYRGIIDLSGTNPDFFFAGTAAAYNSRQEYREAFQRGLLRGDFYREVSPTAMNVEQSSTTEPGHRKVAPQLLSVAESFAPDFERLIARYSVYSTFAGQIMGEGYVSHDAQYYWLFSTDYRGRSWVANIETNAMVTSTGCRQEWLHPTDITTPLYEALRLADGYGDPGDTRTGNYISMWDNYLAKVPLIQNYTAVVKQSSEN